MNIIEAVKSGKRFRRKSVPYVWHSEDKFYCLPGLQATGLWSTEHTLSKEDLTADDWEIEEKKVEITKSQLTDAYFRSTKKNDGLFSIVYLARELGLE